MRNFKKLFSALTALIIILGIIVPVSAVGGNTLTVENTGKSAHTFELYQIFKGDVVEGKSQLSNITWGISVKTPEGEGDALAKAESLTDAKFATQFAKDLIDGKKLSDALQTSGAVEANQTYEFKNLESGYYLVKDKEDSQNRVENGAYTTYILKVVGNVKAQTKLDVPTVSKYVKDINYSEDTDYKDWAKTADYDIGELLPFKLTGTLPANYDEYKTYKYVFHDEMSEGLTFNKESLKVFVDEQEISEGFTVEETNNNSKGFKVLFSDLKTIKNVTITKESKITVEYNAVLNEHAVLGSHGNLNEVYLEYSNNPNYDREGENGPTGNTPKDRVIVFTYKLVVNKVDGEQKPLKGAEFQLEKFNAKTEKYIVVNKFEDEGLTPEGLTSFTFRGLDDGKYRLTESKTPAGYNTIKPIEFKVVASHIDEGLNLESLNGNTLDGSIKLEMTQDLNEGSLAAQVVNKQGPLLPETGGSGTTLIYIVGSVLVLGGALYLFKQRKSIK